MMINKLRSPLRRLGLLAALVTAFGMVFAAPALAHTRLVSSTPGKDATAASVSEVKLVFSDKISVAKVLVKDVQGKEFQQGEAVRQGPNVTQKLAGPLPAGEYTVSYAVVGEDGHRIEKTDLSFTAEGGEAPGGGNLETAEAKSDSPVEEKTGPLEETTDEPAAGKKAAEKKSDDSGSGLVWVMVGGGVLIGIVIGLVIVFRAKRKHPAGKGE
ncbi:copper resistance CopC family protein [Actinomadura hibisca]|uniref:copper resistance CopC family protein n=1 Tax=Actinomadura hibisca TaxID=68565 RepID=UPI00082D687B|nr:copper resistance protein CopC [Actinomadura hibisca]